MVEQTIETKEIRSHVETLLCVDASLELLFKTNYDELREIAHRHRAKWDGEPELDTVGLVSETFLKLKSQSHFTWENTEQFKRVASRAMLHILVNDARYRNMKKRGGKYKHLSIEREESISDMYVASEEQLMLAKLCADCIINRLKNMDERAADIVRHRVFKDHTIEETAHALSISVSTVKRDWRFAKVWLVKELRSDPFDSYHHKSDHIGNT